MYVADFEPQQQKQRMINYKTKQRFRDLNCLTVPQFQNKLKKVKIKDIIPHKSRFNTSDLNDKVNRFEGNNIIVAKEQFRNKLQSYLYQNEQHLKQATDQGQRQRLMSSSEWIKINKKYSNDCKNQSRLNLVKRNYHKKNIKQYISEVALAKRKRNSLKSSPDQEFKSTQIKLKACRQFLITNKWKKKDNPFQQNASEPHSLDKILPIHHTQFYFSQKQFTKRCNLLYSNPSQHQTLQIDQKMDDDQQNLRATEPIFKREAKGQNQSQIELIESQILQKKIRHRYKRPNHGEKYTKTVFAKPKKYLTENNEQMEISPWKPRNTLYSELSIRELQ